MKQMFCDNEGSVSSMRVAFLFVIVVFTIVWAVLSIRQNQLLVPDMKLVAIIGSAFLGKTAQSFSENFSPFHDGPAAPKQS